MNATILQMPRSYYAMAEDGALPAAFLRVDPRTQVQAVGLLFFGATMLVPAFLLGSFEKLLNYVMFTDSLTLVVVASTLFVLRRRAGARDEARLLPHARLSRAARDVRAVPARRVAARVARADTSRPGRWRGPSGWLAALLFSRGA